ncbi:MAG: DUF2505 domain-containing protein [Myxococcales bacterium]|nr:DUF2505 domain-containing protein [Myxococcales bacterium]
MAVRMTFRHTFHTDPDTFWEKVFFDEEYNRRLYLEALNFRGFEQLALERSEDGRVTRAVRTVPQDEAPAAVKKVLGGEFFYREEGSFDPEKKIWSYRVIPSQMASKVDIHGEYWLEDKGGGKSERICTVDLNVKVPFVGKVAEGFIEGQTRRSYDLAETFTNRFLAEKGLSPAS